MSKTFDFEMEIWWNVPDLDMTEWNEGFKSLEPRLDPKTAL